MPMLTGFPFYNGATRYGTKTSVMPLQDGPKRDDMCILLDMIPQYHGETDINGKIICCVCKGRPCTFYVMIFKQCSNESYVKTVLLTQYTLLTLDLYMSFFRNCFFIDFTNKEAFNNVSFIAQNTPCTTTVMWCCMLCRTMYSCNVKFQHLMYIYFDVAGALCPVTFFFATVPSRNPFLSTQQSIIFHLMHATTDQKPTQAQHYVVSTLISAQWRTTKNFS